MKNVLLSGLWVLFVISLAVVGSSFTSVGIENGWYDTLAKPSFTPPGWVIGMVWTIIFFLFATSLVSAQFFLTEWRRTHWRRIAVLNAVVNVLWSYLFFVQHNIILAFFDLLLIELTVLLLVVISWRQAKVAAVLLFPYAGWVLFAGILNGWILYLATV